MKKTKAVIFDMDGVITETSEMHYLAWKKLADALDISFDRDFNEHLKGISRKESLLKILKHGNQMHKFSDLEIESLMTQKNDCYLTLIKFFDETHLNPGVLTFMKTLKEENIKIAVASASKSAPFLIEALKIGNYVDYIVDPSTVPGKPAPDIFSKACDYFHLTPEVCVGVEDANSGVEAIIKAGMKAIGIGDQKTLCDADVVLNSTKDLCLDLLDLLD
ncbi:MAG: beta-phosphoglucomutase [Alkaliphilus sp.]